MGGEQSVVRNVDKRTSRREHRATFEAAVARFRAAPFNPPAELTASGGTTSGRSVRVCVRKRPFFPHEHQQGEFDVVSCLTRRVVIHDARMKADMRHMLMNHTDFTFDEVFGEETGNEDVYAATAQALVVSTACGLASGTVMCYGQTGSGKTFTMGSIYERVALDVFEHAREREVSVCFIELLGDNCFDMLNAGAPCTLTTAADGSVHPYPCVEVTVTNVAELRALIDMAAKLRATAATGVHDGSSRSHACCRIFVRGDETEGCLTLVDLAGTEHRIDSAEHNAERQKEGAKINASLAALKECVRATAAGAKFVPYRRNRLTQLLRGCFSGLEAHPTVIIATVSPSSKDTEHSLNTLRHACIMDGQSQGEGKAGQGAHLTGGAVTTETLGEIDVTKMARDRLAKRRTSGPERDERPKAPPAHQSKQSNTARRAALDKRCLQKLPARVAEAIEAARANPGSDRQRARFRLATASCPEEPEGAAPELEAAGWVETQRERPASLYNLDIDVEGRQGTAALPPGRSPPPDRSVAAAALRAARSPGPPAPSPVLAARGLAASWSTVASPRPSSATAEREPTPRARRWGSGSARRESTPGPGCAAGDTEGGPPAARPAWSGGAAGDATPPRGSGASRPEGELPEQPTATPEKCAAGPRVEVARSSAGMALSPRSSPEPIVEEERSPAAASLAAGPERDAEQEKALELFRLFCCGGREALEWRKNDLRLINTCVVPNLFGARARIDWAHPDAALDELERLVAKSAGQGGAAPSARRTDLLPAALDPADSGAEASRRPRRAAHLADDRPAVASSAERETTPRRRWGPGAARREVTPPEAVGREGRQATRASRSPVSAKAFVVDAAQPALWAGRVSTDDVAVCGAECSAQVRSAARSPQPGIASATEALPTATKWVEAPDSPLQSATARSLDDSLELEPRALLPRTPRHGEEVQPDMQREDNEKALQLFRLFCCGGREACEWRTSDLRLINTHVLPDLFGSRASIDWVHPTAALDELERLIFENPMPAHFWIEAPEIAGADRESRTVTSGAFGTVPGRPGTATGMRAIVAKASAKRGSVSRGSPSPTPAGAGAPKSRLACAGEGTSGAKSPYAPRASKPGPAVAKSAARNRSKSASILARKAQKEAAQAQAEAPQVRVIRPKSIVVSEVHDEELAHLERQVSDKEMGVKQWLASLRAGMCKDAAAT